MENYNKVVKEVLGTFYYLDGKLHRLDGPAIEYSSGYKEWYQNGLLHRLNGPAVEYISGNKKWWFEDKHIDCDSQEEFERYIKLRLFW